MAKTWIVIVLFTALLIGLSTCSDLVTTARTEAGKYTTKLESCSVILDSKPPLSPKGEKGEKGTGETGLRGDKGDSIKGDKGMKGQTGPSGDAGPAGYPGLPGSRGEPGKDGISGERGPSGLQGLSGPPGLPGSCPCLPCVCPTDLDTISEESDSATEVCKNLNSDYWSHYKNSDGYVNMGPGNIQVKCEKKDDKVWTCLKSTSIYPLMDLKEKPDNPFWLSSKRITLMDLYNITYSQLAWIQEKSSEAYQQIAYYCHDSVPFDPEHEDLSPLMLSSNDVVFGPKPQDSTPFTYEIVEGKNDCAVLNPGKKRFTLIKIKSSARRLPAVDFYIRDLRDEFANTGITFESLCFY